MHCVYLIRFSNDGTFALPDTDLRQSLTQVCARQLNDASCATNITIIIEYDQQIHNFVWIALSNFSIVKGTRLFFCDENSKEALYFDIGSSNPVELIGSDRGYVLRDVSMDGNGVLYWLESGEKRILVMGDYERSTHFHIEAGNEFTNPQRIHIARINP